MEKKIIEECPLPCWWGITPGSTQLSEAVSIVSAHGVQITEQSQRHIEWTSASNEVFIGGNLIAVDDHTVMEIQLNIRREYILVKDIVGQFGEPSHVSMQDNPDEGSCILLNIFCENLEMAIAILPQGNFQGVAEDQFVDILTLGRTGSQAYPLEDTTPIEWAGYRDYCAH